MNASTSRAADIFRVRRTSPPTRLSFFSFFFTIPLFAPMIPPHQNRPRPFFFPHYNVFRLFFFGNCWPFPRPESSSPRLISRPSLNVWCLRSLEMPLTLQIPHHRLTRRCSGMQSVPTPCKSPTTSQNKGPHFSTDGPHFPSLPTYDRGLPLEEKIPSFQEVG